MSEAVDIVWLHQLPMAVQHRYFEARQHCYAAAWGRRGVPIDPGFALRDEFDEGDVVAAVDGEGSIIGGVRANVARPGGLAASRLLPMEKNYGIDLRTIYADHDLEHVSYAEASRLFLRDGVGLRQAGALKLRLLNYLLDNVPDVAVTYFVLPSTLLRSYLGLAGQNGIRHDFRVVEGLRPNASTLGDKPTQWGVFACLLTHGVGDAAGERDDG